ncbi:hypothetical protein Droror1_Dr00007204 [Drosera rotundifolia]
MLRERITMEKEFAAFDKLAYTEDPGAIESPGDAKKRLAMRLAKIEQLMAEADVLAMMLTIAVDLLDVGHGRDCSLTTMPDHWRM